MDTLGIMEAVADVEASVGVGYGVEPREVPAPVIKDFTRPPKSKAGSKKKKHRDKERKKGVCTEDTHIEDDLFKAISNPENMLPAPRKKQTAFKPQKPKRRGQKSSVESMSSLSDFSSDGSGLSSIGLGSYESQDLNYDGSQTSRDSFANREEFAVKKRKEDIMQEKIEMLTRISKMSKKGFTATKKWGMRDDIDEIRFECYRMTRESNSKKAIKNMQHVLITVATVLEFANNMINPFNLKLQGFSRNMMLTVSDYDDSLEEIHHKWSGRTYVGPELNVLFTFATSAVFHHAGNVTSSSGPATSREPPDPAPKAGMGLGDMSSMLGLFSNMMNKGSAAPPASTPGPASRVPEQPKQRRSMKGPSFPTASMDLPE